MNSENPLFLKEYLFVNFDFSIGKSCYNFFFVETDESKETLKKELISISSSFNFQLLELNNLNFCHIDDHYMVVDLNDISHENTIKLNGLESQFKKTPIKINFIISLENNTHIYDKVFLAFREYWEFRTISITEKNNEIKKHGLKKELSTLLTENTKIQKKHKI